jgi:adenylate cyclase class IV
MPKEIEAKIKVTLEESRKAYEELRNSCNEPSCFVDPIPVLETNTYFDRRGTLQKQGLALRTRQTWDRTGAMTQVITYKGPLLKGKYKTREELELPIQTGGRIDSHTMGKLLPCLGFNPTISFHKRRHECTFIKSGGDPGHGGGSSLSVKIKVAFDQLPTIGHFIEVEGEKVEDIKYALEIMGLAGRKSIKQGYPDLLRKKFPKQVGILFALKEMEPL